MKDFIIKIAQHTKSITNKILKFIFHFIYIKLNIIPKPLV